MSNVSPNHLQESGKSPAASPTQPGRVMRPGWPEIVVGLFVLAAVSAGVALPTSQLGLNPVVYGLVLTALSGVAPLVGFVAAALLRIRSLSAFGLRRVSRRWLLIGVGLGVVTFVIKGLAVMAYTAVTGDSSTPQTVYAGGGSGGLLYLILATLFIGVLTPVSEELLFRGILTNALLRYGPFIGVGASTIIFALAHGINAVFPGAVVMGLVGGEVFRRSGSVWPGVVAHTVVNLPAIPVLVLVGTA